MIRSISILGSTGSIGRQTLDVAKKLNLKITSLAAKKNVELMEQQVRQFRPHLAVMTDSDAARALRLRLADMPTKVLSGEEALCKAATEPETDAVVIAVMGMVGLKPTLAAIREKKRIALANKETLVCAGELVMAEADRCGAEIVPVDSEHSAIFQCLQGCRDRKEVKRLILTCSGGPFFGKTREELRAVTREDALRHPNWSMGAKITVDSATLMNKGLEVIEAMRLYRLPLSKVDVVIHRQSIIHSLVEFRDGAVLAQLGTPDMRLPIRYALTWPARCESTDPTLDLLSCPPLTFDRPNMDAFPSLRLALEAAQEGGTACAVLNAANEEAVERFLSGKIHFQDIPELVERARQQIKTVPSVDLISVLEADRETRAVVKAIKE